MTVQRQTVEERLHQVESRFSRLIGQSRVREFLVQAVTSDRVSHAMLFVGPPGSGKTDAAYALAQVMLCDMGGCGACDTCVRVARKTHPDVRYLSPEGSYGYVISQIRELLRECNLAPIRASKKIYIIDRIDLLNGAPANAFLKTLEEPPDDVMFILLGRTREAVMPTILSRCQVVPFRRIPASEQVGILSASTGCDERQAGVALAACGGSVSKARSFLLSPSRLAVRQEILGVLDRIEHADDLDILDGAKTLLCALKAPIADVKVAQEQQLKEGADYLARGAMKLLEERQKRELGQREREAFLELTAIARSWLRDCLTVANGAEDYVVNIDDIASIRRIVSSAETARIICAIKAVDIANERIAYNVSPQLVIECMLFDIREALLCQK